MGALAGIGGRHLNSSSDGIYIYREPLDVVNAMHPAVVKVNIDDLKEDGIVILKIDASTNGHVDKAGYESNPPADDSLKNYWVFEFDMTPVALNVIAAI